MVVPLFVDIDGVPDFGWMDAATAAIAEGLQPGTLVSYETTLPIGTTRDRFRPVLESGGLVCGRDFWLVFSPERVLTGRVFADLRRYPKLVGGVDEESTGPRHRVLPRRSWTSTTGRTWPAPTVSGTSAAPRQPSWPSWPRRPTATSTSGWPTSSRSSPRGPASTSTR